MNKKLLAAMALFATVAMAGATEISISKQQFADACWFENGAVSDLFGYGATNKSGEDSGFLACRGADGKLIALRIDRFFVKGLNDNALQKLDDFAKTIIAEQNSNSESTISSTELKKISSKDKR